MTTNFSFIADNMYLQFSEILTKIQEEKKEKEKEMNK